MEPHVPMTSVSTPAELRQDKPTHQAIDFELLAAIDGWSLATCDLKILRGVNDGAEGRGNTQQVRAFLARPAREVSL